MKSNIILSKERIKLCNSAKFWVKMSFCCEDIDILTTQSLVRNVCHFEIGVTQRGTKISADLTSLSKIHVYICKKQVKLHKPKKSWAQKSFFCKDINNFINSLFSKKCMVPPCWCRSERHQHGGQNTNCQNHVKIKVKSSFLIQMSYEQKFNS